MAGKDDDKRAATRDELAVITPAGYSAVAERCLIEGATLAQARAALLAEHARRHPPVGTPEPPAPTVRTRTVVTPSPNGGARLQDLSTRDFRRALLGN